MSKDTLTILPTTGSQGPFYERPVEVITVCWSWKETWETYKVHVYKLPLRGRGFTDQKRLAGPLKRCLHS